MNERIRELAKKVDACYIPLYDMWQMDTETLEKFAELIVRECVRIGQETSKDIFKMSKKEDDIFEYESHGAEQVVDNIKEHFGVE